MSHETKHSDGARRLVPWEVLAERQARLLRDGDQADLLWIKGRGVLPPPRKFRRTRGSGWRKASLERLKGEVSEGIIMMIWARGDRVSASRRKLTQALEQGRLVLSPPDSQSGRDGEESKIMETPTRHDRTRDESWERKDGEEEDAKDGSGYRRRLVASPPIVRKRPHGVRPYAGRTPRLGGDGRREETQGGHGGEFPCSLPKEREAGKTHLNNGSVGSGEGSSDSPRVGIRGSHGGDGFRKQEVDLNTSKDWRHTAVEREGTRRQQGDSDTDADAATLETSGVDAEHCAALRAAEGDRSRHGSEIRSVRAVAENFVGSVLGDVSSEDSLSRISMSSRMSLSLK
ncbi:unnamed protein product [Scytosiphon promiscuus]